MFNKELKTRIRDLEEQCSAVQALKNDIEAKLIKVCVENKDLKQKSSDVDRDKKLLQKLEGALTKKHNKADELIKKAEKLEKFTTIRSFTGDDKYYLDKITEISKNDAFQFAMYMQREAFIDQMNNEVVHSERMYHLGKIKAIEEILINFRNHTGEPENEEV